MKGGFDPLRTRHFNQAKQDIITYIEKKDCSHIQKLKPYFDKEKLGNIYLSYKGKEVIPFYIALQNYEGDTDKSGGCIINFLLDNTDPFVLYGSSITTNPKIVSKIDDKIKKHISTAIKNRDLETLRKYAKSKDILSLKLNNKSLLCAAIIEYFKNPDERYEIIQFLAPYNTEECAETKFLFEEIEKKIQDGNYSLIQLYVELKSLLINKREFGKAPEDDFVWSILKGREDLIKQNINIGIKKNIINQPFVSNITPLVYLFNMYPKMAKLVVDKMSNSELKRELPVLIKLYENENKTDFEYGMQLSMAYIIRKLDYNKKIDNDIINLINTEKYFKFFKLLAEKSDNLYVCIKRGDKCYDINQYLNTLSGMNINEMKNVYLYNRKSRKIK
jgi:hypothetical protein